ncbi:hypothetical protein [Thalassotalea marina]|uniref:Uncharacterized protein n=1 Tax=Thalassotalea marina TaxID=1673741 RepID=A0A919BR13_9GAMM|nr:hypothetical protein [Thalassotalea marina]GHG07222.1 hypothetical protein GCM10017161_41190 [Thalassotalea marina]
MALSDIQNRTSVRLEQKKLRLEIDILQLEKIKQEAQLELIKEEIRSKRTGRYIMRVTAMVTGLSLLTTIFNHLGLFNK